MPENIRDPRPNSFLMFSACRRPLSGFAATRLLVLEIMPFSNVRTLEAGRAIVEGANQPNGLIFGIWRAAVSTTRKSAIFRGAS